MNNNIPKCPECGALELFHNKEKGEIICRDCGLVIEDKLINFEFPVKLDSNNVSSRDGVGPTISYRYPDQGLFTHIFKKDIANLPSPNKNTFYRIQRWQRRTISSLEKNLIIALDCLRLYVSNLSLPLVVEEEAARLYTYNAYNGLTRGRSIELIVASSIYIACRTQNVPCTMLNIAHEMQLTKKELGRTIRGMLRENHIILIPQNPTNYVSKICTTLRLSEQVQTKAITIIETLYRKNPLLLSGKGPLGIAASAIYLSALMCQEKQTQSKIAKIADITEVTLRNRYHDIITILKINPEIKRGKYKNLLCKK